VRGVMLDAGPHGQWVAEAISGGQRAAPSRARRWDNRWSTQRPGVTAQTLPNRSKREICGVEGLLYERSQESELSHVCAWSDLDCEFGVEGLSETVEDAKAGYGAASFEPSYC
jgi:hypothetical protein